MSVTPVKRPNQEDDLYTIATPEKPSIPDQQRCPLAECLQMLSHCTTVSDVKKGAILSQTGQKNDVCRMDFDQCSGALIVDAGMREDCGKLTLTA